MELKYQVLKLKTGDSIISEVNETTDNTISLHRPMSFKVVTMLNESMTPTDVLLFRNWAEFTKDEDISISKDMIASSWTPDEVILNCYELEKLKQDMPEIYKMLKKNDEDLPPVNPPFIPGFPPPSSMPPKTNNVPNGMANFNLTLPMDVAKGLIEYLEQNGVDLQGPGFDDNDGFNDIDDIPETKDDFIDESFGNHPDDWSPDPNDYTK
jgi:hypothetical protein